MIKKETSAFFCLILLLIFFISSFLSPLFLAHSYDQVFENQLNLPPFWLEGGNIRFLLGTDDLGRDFFVRLLYGGKVSFFIGFFVTSLVLFFGVFFGVLSGFYTQFDISIVRLVDILMSFPGLLLALIVVSLLGPGLFNSCIAVSLMCLPAMIRFVRSLVLREKYKSYVEVSSGFGAHNLRLIFFHILPNCMGEIIVQALLIFSEGILSVAALSFLGLGASSPLAEWGLMIADGRPYLESSWWLVSFPGICILVMIFCINILGEKIRDFLDPKTSLFI